MSYLDKNGVTYLWSKIKALVDEPKPICQLRNNVSQFAYTANTPLQLENATVRTDETRLQAYKYNGASNYNSIIILGKDVDVINISGTIQFRNTSATYKQAFVKRNKNGTVETLATFFVYGTYCNMPIPTFSIRAQQNDIFWIEVSSTSVINHTKDGGLRTFLQIEKA